MHEYVEERDGGLYVSGTRITLDSIILPFKNGASPESILRSFPAIGSLERAYGAITYYLAHKDEVEAFLADQKRLVAEALAHQGPLPPTLAEKLRSAREDAAPRSS